jgi:glucose-6-phosphate 1-epimerase
MSIAAHSGHHSSPSPAARVRLQRGADHAEIATHGAQVLSWQCAGRERLYLSPRATFAPGQAIRGGVPVIFPQFSDRGSGLRHGFARLREWEVQLSADPAEAHFSLHQNEDSLRYWPHAFRAELVVTLLERSLSIALQITNSGTETLAFTAALHSYIRVNDLAETQLAGLEGQPYLDSTQAGAMAIQPEAPLQFGCETDRIYPDAMASLQLFDGTGALRIEQDGFRDVVVWNPGAALSTRLGDLGPGEHVHFVCVEAASVARPVQLAPAATWEGRQVLTVAP